jgi:ribosomal protein L24E
LLAVSTEGKTLQFCKTKIQVIFKQNKGLVNFLQKNTKKTSFTTAKRAAVQMASETNG